MQNESLGDGTAYRRLIGATNERGEYHRFLHVFTMSPHWGHNPDHNPPPGMTAIAEHDAYPWPYPANVEPALDHLAATWEVTNFDGFPAHWHYFWRSLASMRYPQRGMYKFPLYRAFGPYWMLLKGGMGSHLPAQVLVDWKREATLIATQPMRSGIKRAPISHEALMTDVESQLLMRLRPFKVLTEKEEMADAHTRSREDGTHPIPEWDRYSFGRPPRCW